MKRSIARALVACLALASASALEFTLALVDAGFGRHALTLAVDGKPVKILWAALSYDRSIVEIDRTGLITPLKAGTTTIAATLDGSVPEIDAIGAAGLAANLEYATRPVDVEGIWYVMRGGKEYTIARFQLAFGRYNAGVVNPHRLLRQSAATWPVDREGWELAYYRFTISGDAVVIDEPMLKDLFSLKAASGALLFKADSGVLELSRRPFP
ncbi:MAG: hypothetical protein KBC36_04705 [Spirochaetia bacterium]|nr:hypothetical protein [Spirochaetia bacterium]